jgi:hypothetical protein
VESGPARRFDHQPAVDETMISEPFDPSLVRRRMALLYVICSVRASLFLAIGISLTLVGCGGRAASHVGTISGHVISYQCKTPLPSGRPCPASPVVGTIVSFQPKGGGVGLSVRTDSAGFFTVRAPAGDYVVDVPSAPAVAINGEHVRIVEGPRESALAEGSRLSVELIVQSPTL